MASIKQNLEPTLPDFRNLGVMLRILIIVNSLAVLGALIKAPALDATWDQLLAISAWVQPILLASLLLLNLLRDALFRLPYQHGAVAILFLECALVAGFHFLAAPILSGAALDRSILLTLLACGGVLAYLDLRQRALSPAITEARLQALQARIRPHFLFNSLNAVLSLIRDDPRRAETALEDLADLYRVVMADAGRLSTLKEEVELCHRYLDLEQLRLGGRLKVEWHVDNMPEGARIPPLLLQPLLENAVYHGIEPALKPGTISVHVYQRGGRVHAVLRNPCSSRPSLRRGNQIALANIAERLALHFDAEASVTTKLSDDVFEAHITLPYLNGSEQVSGERASSPKPANARGMTQQTGELYPFTKP
jgi:two-component system, LytTR family, sensor histidine kinase AlgZ